MALGLSGCSDGAVDKYLSPIKSAVGIEDEEPADEREDVFKFQDVLGTEYEAKLNREAAPTRWEKHRFSLVEDRMTFDNEGLPRVSYKTGIDVSHHQESINWDLVKESGIEFAFLRIGYRGYGESGSLNQDREFESNFENAKKAKIKVGVYFFAQAINEQEAMEEAEYVLSLLDNRLVDLYVVYDPEDILDDVARTDGLTSEQLTENARVFCERITLGGYKPMIYANTMWEAFKLDMGRLKDFPFWYADYSPMPQTPYDFTVWQYTCEGSVPGVEGPVDLNIWMRDR